MKEKQGFRVVPNDAEKKEKKSKISPLWVGSVIVLLLAAITFIFIPTARSSGRGGAGGAEPFGYYNKKPIELTPNSYFARRIEQYQQIARWTGRSLENSALQIFQQAFDDTVIYEVFSSAVAKSGYVSPEKAIDRAMLPYFYDENGVYSPKRFNAASEADKITLRKEVTANLVFQRYYSDFFGAAESLAGDPLYGRKKSSKETEFLKKLSEKERGFDLAAFDTSNYPESEAVAFAKERGELFTVYDMSVISVPTEDEAKKLLQRIKNSEVTFEDAVKDLSTKIYSGAEGKLNSSYHYQLKNIISGEENLQVVTALGAGELSGAVQTANGYSIFRCDAPSSQPDFDSPETAQTALSYVRSYERSVIEEYYIGIARDFAAAASRDGFARACSAFNVEPVEVQPFPLNYGNSSFYEITPSSSVTQLAGAEKNENFLKILFSLKQGEISAPVVLGNNVLVVRLTSIVDAESKSDAESSITSFASTADDQAMRNAALADERLQNNFFTVFFKYYMGN